MRDCETLVSEHERLARRAMHTVMRLRPDLFWEARVHMPRRLDPRVIYVPGSDSQGGVNDHMAFGTRDAMRPYLRRLEHTTEAGHARLSAYAAPQRPAAARARP